MLLMVSLAVITDNHAVAMASYMIIWTKQWIKPVIVMLEKRKQTVCLRFRLLTLND